ncbi:uncharacterized protein TNCV_3234201 [Trichonephila clavipes]|nr:uncharacterized protein TNCV_3234201 [Trichonephila clavipes]
MMTTVQKESDPVDDETDKDEDNNNNESSKGLSNADAFSALETAMEGYEQQSEFVLFSYYCSRESETLQRKNKGVQGYSEKLVIVFHNKGKIATFCTYFAFSSSTFPHMMTFNIRIVSGFIYCMDRIRFSVIRTIAYPNGVRSQLIRIYCILMKFF